LNVPADLWWQTIDYQFIASGWQVGPTPQPDPSAMDEAVGIIAAVKRPLILAGAGMVDARRELVELSEKIGAPLATTLKAKDLFHDHPHSVGIFGSFATETCLNAIADSDCIIAF